MTKIKSCPICKLPVVESYRPFCSARCKDIDLGNWFRGNYFISAVEDEEKIEESDQDNSESINPVI